LRNHGLAICHKKSPNRQIDFLLAPINQIFASRKFIITKNQIKMMRKRFLAILSGLCLFSVTSLYAQNTFDDREYHSAVQVSFFPPLSTNGLHSGRYTNCFSFNILAGLSKNEQAFTLGGIANIIHNNATGFELAGVTNYVGNEGRGFQIAGVNNMVGGCFKGFQLGGVLNTAGDATGVQLGGVANIARDLAGFQLGGVANVARNVKGFQFGGVANIAHGDVAGFQFGGVLNVAKRVHGVQFAGVVNIAEKSDYPIGFVNIIKEGEMGIGIGYNEIGTMSLTLRSGGRVLYGILGLGYNHNVKKGEDAMSLVAGYGAHINILPWLRINNELTVESIDIIEVDNSTFKAGYALLPAFRFGHFEIFGGPSVNFMQTDEPKMHDIFPKSNFWSEERASGRLQQAFVGWQAGAQFIF
jgi:hypothetical protein